MKAYLIYLKPRNILYAISNDKKLVKQFLSERNNKLFHTEIKTVDNDEWLMLLNGRKLLRLQNIPLEDSNGDYNIIGTIVEDNQLTAVCEKMMESCYHIKQHFTNNVPFKNEYKY